MNGRTYAIIDDAAAVDFGAVLETAAENLRFSVDGAQTVVKFVGATPPFLAGKTLYNHAEIRALMATPEWATPANP
jgi:hypothetical protein